MKDMAKVAGILTKPFLEDGFQIVMQQKKRRTKEKAIHDI